MIQKTIHILRGLPSYFRREKYCIVVEENEESVKISEIYISEIEKTLRVVNTIEAPSIEYCTRPFFRADYLIFATHKKNATTIQNTVNLVRTHPEKIIDDAECEDLIFRGLWEYLNEHRGFSSKKMGVNDTDIILSSIAISELSIDGHTVVNPTEVAGKNIAIRFRGTFLPKKEDERISKIKSWANETLIVESRAAISIFLSGDNDAVLFCGEEQSSAFQAKTDRTIYAGDIRWKGSVIFKEIREALGIDEENAKLLFDRYVREEMSVAFSGFCDRIFSKHTRTFLKSVDETTKKQGRSHAPTIHLIFSFETPKHIHWLKNTSRFKIDSLEEKFFCTGFRIIYKNKKSSIATHTGILSIYPISFPKNERINRFLSRRAKWIT